MTFTWNTLCNVHPWRREASAVKTQHLVTNDKRVKQTIVTLCGFNRDLLGQTRDLDLYLCTHVCGATCMWLQWCDLQSVPFNATLRIKNGWRYIYLIQRKKEKKACCVLWWHLIIVWANHEPGGGEEISKETSEDSCNIRLSFLKSLPHPFDGGQVDWRTCFIDPTSPSHWREVH